MSEEKTISVSMSKVQELLRLLSDAKQILHGAQTGKEELAETTAEEA